MKSDFLVAITQLSAEKNLPKEVVLSAVEAALSSAYKKDTFAANRSVSVKIDPNTGKVKVLVEKTVVEKPSDTRHEVALAEAQRINPEIQVGEAVEVEDTPVNAGRIAAQTAKQVILQRLHEAEHSAILEEYAHKEGDIVSGAVQRIEPKQIIVDLGRAEAILPASEQVRTDRYRIGQRLKFYLLEVMRAARGPQLIVSRSHRELARRLFELEVSEVYSGVVEIKAVAREAGFRTKVSVAARQEGVDPVGCCVGLRGIRIQNIINELGGEKIDVVLWDGDPAVFIANALSPARVVAVKLGEAEDVAIVVVPDKQLSLAIGKEGQNARLAAKLTGWRIDIKSVSTVEVETPVPVEVPEAVAETVVEELPVEELPIVEPALVATEAVGEPAELPAVPFEPPAKKRKPELRFAEDIMIPGPLKPEVVRGKKKKKPTRGKVDVDAGPKTRKPRRAVDITDDEEEEDYLSSGGQ
ncbi:transcription termination factor NusA [Chloroflexota bacterium]